MANPIVPPQTAILPPSAKAPRRVDDTRITEITELAPPSHLLRELPLSEPLERGRLASSPGLQL